jgi:hypothetical protein
LSCVQAKDISVIIQPAGHIIEARLRAMLAKVTGEFQEGHELDDKTVQESAKTPDRPGAVTQGSDGAFEEVGVTGLS